MGAGEGDYTAGEIWLFYFLCTCVVEPSMSLCGYGHGRDNPPSVLRMAQRICGEFVTAGALFGAVGFIVY